MTEKYQTKTYKPLGAFLLCFAAIIVALCLGVLIAVGIDNDIFTYIICFSAFIVPLLFIKKIKSLFTKTVWVVADEHGLTIIPDGGSITQIKSYDWAHVIKYKLIPDNTFTYLNLTMDDGSHARIHFLEASDSFEPLKQDDVLKYIFTAIKAYNSSSGRKIELRKSLLLTKGGTAALVFILLLLVTAIVMICIKHPKSFAFTIAGAGQTYSCW